MGKFLLGIIKFIGFVLLIVLVKACPNPFVKSQYEEDTREKREESSSNFSSSKNDEISLAKNKFRKDSHEVIKEMGKTSDLDKKLKLLIEYTNKKLPIKIDNIELYNVELLENREVRYYNRLLGDTESITEYQWQEQKDNILNNVKYSDQFKLFRKYGIIMSYAYYDTKGKLLRTIRILPNDYK